MRLSSLAGFAAVAACLALAPASADAQGYPAKPIKFIVPAPPGGAIDILARLVGEKLAASMGQPVIVENKPGASNNLGTDLIAKSAPDGYTIGIVGGSHNINKFLFKDLPWDPEKSFEPIVYTHVVPLVFAIHPGIPAKTLPELITWLKANPDKAKVATSGRGSAQEMAAEMFQMMSGAKLLMVPYKGSSAAHPDLLAGRTALYIDTISAIQGHVKSGAGRAVAISTAKRSSALPDLATADEQGLKGYDANTNGGILAPAGTPMDIVTKLNAEINAGLADAAIKSRLTDLGGAPLQGSPAEFGKLIAEQTERWGDVIRTAHIKPE